MAYILILLSSHFLLKCACREWLRGIVIEILIAKANKNNPFVFEKFSRVYVL